MIMIIAILGHPLAGKQKLADALGALLSARVVTMTTIRELIEQGESPQATRARSLAEAGNLVPASLLAELFAEAVGHGDALLVGWPRELDELVAFERTFGCAMVVVHLDAQRSLIDARRAAAGLRSIEEDHPGALQRLEAKLQPVLLRMKETGSLLSMDASLPFRELVDRAQGFINQRKPFDTRS